MHLVDLTFLLDTILRAEIVCQAPSSVFWRRTFSKLNAEQRIVHVQLIVELEKMALVCDVFWFSAQNHCRQDGNVTRVFSRTILFPE